MRSFLVTMIGSAAAMTIAAGVASAQPSMTPVVPAPYAYQPGALQLSVEDQQLLVDGEMPIAQHAGGGALAFMLGFGTGQLAQGRWTDTGWIFTFGDTASLVALIDGISQFKFDCYGSGSYCDNTRAGWLLAAGMIGTVGFHIWEVLDAFIVPANHNRRIRELRMQLGYPPPPPRYGMYVAPPLSPDGGAIAGVSLKF